MKKTILAIAAMASACAHPATRTNEVGTVALTADVGAATNGLRRVDDLAVYEMIPDGSNWVCDHALKPEYVPWFGKGLDGYINWYVDKEGGVMSFSSDERALTGTIPLGLYSREILVDESWFPNELHFSRPIALYKKGTNVIDRLATKSAVLSEMTKKKDIFKVGYGLTETRFSGTHYRFKIDNPTLGLPDYCYSTIEDPTDGTPAYADVECTVRLTDETPVSVDNPYIFEIEGGHMQISGGPANYRNVTDRTAIKPEISAEVSAVDLAFKRDLTNNVCAVNAFCEWVAHDVPAGVRMIGQPTYNGSSFEWPGDDGFMWFTDSNISSEIAETTFTSGHDSSLSFTATRMRLAVSNETFVTKSFVKDSAAATISTNNREFAEAVRYIIQHPDQFQ